MDAGVGGWDMAGEGGWYPHQELILRLGWLQPPQSISLAGTLLQEPIETTSGLCLWTEFTVNWPLHCSVQCSPRPHWLPSDPPHQPGTSSCPQSVQDMQPSVWAAMLAAPGGRQGTGRPLAGTADSHCTMVQRPGLTAYTYVYLP